VTKQRHPTASAMRRLLTVCDEYSREYCISFNVSNTKCLVAMPRSRHVTFDHVGDCLFFINKQPIEIVESFAHLGHRITSLLDDDDDDIINRRSDFTGQVNNVLRYFKALDTFVRFTLFTSYCTSLYGCELWSLTNRRVGDLCVAWRKSLRVLWRLLQCTHKYLLHSISHCLPAVASICLEHRGSKFLFPPLLLFLLFPSLPFPLALPFLPPHPLPSPSPPLPTPLLSSTLPSPPFPSPWSGGPGVLPGKFWNSTLP
jgi:hypothetical protein